MHELVKEVIKVWTLARIKSSRVFNTPNFSPVACIIARTYIIGKTFMFTIVGKSFLFQQYSTCNCNYLFLRSAHIAHAEFIGTRITTTPAHNFLSFLG